MSLLRIIGAFIVFIFLGIFGLLAVLFKIISAILGPKPKTTTKPANGASQSTPPQKAANGEVIEVEVISVRKED